MAIELIDKIKQKNGGTFKLIDACDVEMKDGSDLETYLENLEPGSGECTSTVYAGNEEPEDENVVVYIDTNDDIGEANNNISGTVLEEIQAMFKFLKGKIDALEADNIILKSEIEALKQGQIVVPDPDEEVVTITGAVLLPDGTPLLFDDESYMLYGNGSISSAGGTGEDNISVTGAILLDDGTPLLLNDGAVLLYENGKVTTESTAGTVEIKGAILLDNNLPLLLNNGDYLLYNNGEIKE